MVRLEGERGSLEIINFVAPQNGCRFTTVLDGVATQQIKLTGARERIAKKTYIRAPKYPQAAFDKALAECKADSSWKTFVNEDTPTTVRFHTITSRAPACSSAQTAARALPPAPSTSAV